MWSFESIVLLIVIDFVFDGFLLVVAATVDGLLSESGFDDIELAEMASALALPTAAFAFLVVSKVVAAELLGSASEDLFFPTQSGMVSFHVVGLVGL